MGILDYSVTSLGYSTFLRCSNLISINVNKDNLYYCNINGILFNKDVTEFLCYPAGKQDVIYAVPDSVTLISDYAFGDCSSLTEVTIPNSVTTIGNSVFWHCDNLNSIDIPDSITEIGAYAFNGCDSLIIYGNVNSYAETFAEENDIPFIDIEKITPPVTTPATTSAITTNTTHSVTTSTTPTVTTATTPTYVINLGDINLNGKIGDLSDVISLGKFLGNKSALTDTQKENANVHSDVGLTSNDLIVLVKLSFGEITIADLPQ